MCLVLQRDFRGTCVFDCRCARTAAAAHAGIRQKGGVHARVARPPSGPTATSTPRGPEARPTRKPSPRAYYPPVPHAPTCSISPMCRGTTPPSWFASLNVSLRAVGGPSRGDTRITVPAVEGRDSAGGDARGRVMWPSFTMWMACSHMMAWRPPIFRVSGRKCLDMEPVLVRPTIGPQNIPGPSMKADF